jgi:hypothetical protein
MTTNLHIVNSNLVSSDRTCLDEAKKGRRPDTTCLLLESNKHCIYHGVPSRIV